MDKKLQEYAELQATIKTAEARQKIVKAEIEEELGQQEVVQKTEFGVFKMVGRKTWEYPEMTKIMAEDLKIQQTEDQEQGIATHTTAYSLRFNAKKAV